MSKSTGELVSVNVIPNEQGHPPGKLAVLEVVFEAEAGPLSGKKLIGFAVWERRDWREKRDAPSPADVLITKRHEPFPLRREYLVDSGVPVDHIRIACV